MMRFIFPIILFVASIGLFLGFTNPIFKTTKELKAEVATYTEALANSKQLEERRDELVAKYNEFAPSDVERLRKLLPDNVDNIRLILEIDYIASRYGMSVTNVAFDVDNKEAAGAENAIAEGGASLNMTNRDIGTFDLSFSTQASYDNFQKFLADLESSLRIVDIQGITFDSTAGEGKDFYKYNIKIKTYWLKN